LFTGCNLFNSSDDNPPALHLISSTEISVAEPSGLALDVAAGFLYCVSDPPHNQVHKLDLAGNVLSTLDFVGQDLEGICFDSRNGTLWIVDEATTELIHLSATGNELSRTPVNYSVPDTKSGLEGICFRPGHNDFYIVKQKDPAAIIYVDSNLVTQNSKTLTIANDITAISLGREEDQFLMISAGEQRLYEWSWSQGLLATYRFDVKQAEGLVYDPTSALLYMVCDSESLLYTYQFPE